MARNKDGVPLSIKPREAETKLNWTIRHLREAVADGRLQPGDRLPSHRDLALQWQVSRGLVTTAYEQLQTEGVLITRKGSGTFVAELGESSAKELPSDEALDFERSPIDMRLPFLAREADVSLFPISIWQRHVGTALKQDAEVLLLDKSLMGIPSLRLEVSTYLAFSRGIKCSPEDIMITTGARHAMDLIARAMLRLTREVWVEDPGYAQASFIFTKAGLTCIPVPVDEQGLMVDEGRRKSSTARLVFVTPAHQAPTGVLMSQERRAQLLAWANQQDGYIIEDDYDGCFTFTSARVPSLKSIDADQRVFHMGSFNKLLFPSLRLGYLVIPPALRRDLQEIKAASGWSTGALEQLALATFIREGCLSRHLRHAERVYARRCRLAIESIEAAFGERIEVTGAHGGVHFCLWFAETALAEIRTLAPALKVQPVRRLDSTGALESGVVIGFASLSEEVIRRSGAVLGLALRSAKTL
ncbi:PLP-dependent aminotransferase family protein [Pseudomonas sp. RC10]|uniref:MocR-like pyridoxine biosynthesis transcription factor PdxR n=1 Tax=Pseudomonas bambusae TaxID=3139142 RepID=UPI003138851C